MRSCVAGCVRNQEGSGLPHPGHNQARQERLTRSISASRAQPQAQILLMVFVDVELPEGASAAERARFEQGQGGALTPRMCLDRRAADLQDWASLA